MLVFVLIKVMKMQAILLFLSTNNPVVVFCSPPLSQKLVGFQFFPGHERPSGPMGEPPSFALCPARRSCRCSMALRDSSIHQPLDHGGRLHQLHCHTRCSWDTQLLIYLLEYPF